MPRETVYGIESPFVALVPLQPPATEGGSAIEVTFDTTPDRAPVVEVGWARELGVQIVTKLEGSTARLAEAGEPLPPLPFEDGFTVDLDRRGVNDLIRRLRRARDQAFGRDE